MGLGIQNYESSKKRFPPAYLADPQGRPLHSWRLLTFPFVEGRKFYDQCKLDEPWNSEANQALVARSSFYYTGGMYRCPADSKTKELDTTTVMIVGPRAFGNGPTRRTSRQIVDGASRTIATAEMSQSGIHWMEPRDLNCETMSYRVNDFQRPSIRSTHPGGAVVGFADGFVHSINENIDPEVLRGLITIDGGEDTSAHWNEQ